MVKKTKLQANELPVENDLDIPDFNFDIEEPKDDRSPVHKILAAAGQGAKDSFNDSSYVKRLLRASMPPVYGEIDDIATNAKDNVKKLYNTAAKEIKPSVAELTRATEKLVPEGSRSKKVLKSIREWAEDHKIASMTGEDKNRIRDRNISLEIADIFAQQAELQQSHQAEDKAEGKIRESIDLMKHRESQVTLGQINQSMSRLVQYQDKITQAFQRKSLELQYRSYFVGMESLEEAKRSNEFNKATMLSIVKNTALPEFVKIKNSERIHEFARNKLIESLFGGTQAFMNKTFANIGNILKEYTDIAKDGFFSATMAAEGAEMMKGMSDKSMSESIAEGGAKGLVQYGAMKMGGKARDFISRNKTVNKIAGQAKYGVTNLPELATEYANSQNFEDGPFKSFGKSLLRDFIGNQKPDSSLMADGIKDGTDPGMYTKFTNKSITEIIPGYLSRIFRELQILRTGDETIKLTGYDIYSNKFTDTGSLKKTILSRLIPESSIKSHKETGKEIFDLIDPENKLSEEERSDLLNKLTSDKFDRKRASYERLTAKHTYKSDPKLADSADKIAASFEKYFTEGGKISRDSDEFLERRNKLSGKFGQLGRFMNNPAAELQNLINAGYYEQLREMGFIDELGSKINMDEVLRRHNPSGVPESFVDSNTAMAAAKRQKKINGITQDTSRVKMELPQGLSEALLENSKTLRDFINSNKENQYKFDAFVESQNNSFSNLNNSFKDGSMKVDALTTNEILLRIEDFLVNKLQFTGGGNNNTFSDPENQGYYKDTLWNNTRGIASRLKNTLYDKMGKPLSKKIIDTTKWSMDSGLKGAKWGLDKIVKSSNVLANILVSARDIFVDGDPKAKLTAAGIKAGEYYDSVTGKVIKSIDDLKKCKGDIFDSSKNIVLAKTDFAKTYVRNIKGSGIIKIGESIFGKALAFGKASSNAFINTGSRVLGTISSIKRVFFNLLDQPIDLYIKGTDTPILLASIMRTGGYISEATGRPVMRPSEIDGPLKDLKGNFALTLDQLKQGLEDINGNKIKTPLMKIIGAGIGMVKTGMKTAIKLGRFGIDTVKGGLEKGGDFFKGMLESLSGGLGGKKSTDVLEQIRNILDDRLPESKKRFGDKDGDGDRDGGWQDMLQNKKTTEEDNSSTDPTVKADRKNTFDRISDGIGSIKDKVAGLFGMGEDDEGVDVDIEGDERGRGRRRGRRGRTKGLRKGGSIRNTGRVLGNIGGAAMGAAGWAGRGLIGAGKFALPALATGLGAVGSLAGGLMSGIGAIASGIAGAISLPVVLGAAAVGLAAYGGYKLYKHLNKVDLTPLTKLRMAQYGFSKDDSDAIGRTVNIENLVLPQVKYKDGQADFDIDDILIPRLLEASDIDPEDRSSTNIKQIRKWTRWFSSRFKPVFLTHLTTIKNTDPNQTLTSVDKMDPNLKLKMLPALKFSDGPYGFEVSPFSDLDVLPAGRDLINFTADEAEKAIKEEIQGSGEKNKKLGAGTTMATAVAGTAAVSSGASDIKAEAIKPPPPLTFKDKLLKGLKSSAMFMLNPFAALGALVVSSIGPTISKRFGFDVKAFEAVRFKAYGLVEMDRSKVVALRNLEEQMVGKVSFNATGSATFNGSVSEILKNIGGDFNIGGPGSREANLWSVWFGTRFLPVYLNYMGLVKQITGTDSVAKAEKALSSSQQLEIAKKLIATPQIWSIATSPWLDYVLNTESSSTKENIKYLEDNSAKDKLNEQKSTSGSKVAQTVASKTTAANGGSASSKPPMTIKEQGPDGVYDRLPGYSQKGTEAVLSNEGYRDKYDIMAAKGKDQTSSVKNVVPGSKRSKGNFSGFGADIDTYIREASQMFGVDEKILRGFVKMEAGWTGKMSPTGAIGTGQFIKSTWDSLAQTEEGKKIGMTVIGDRFRTENDPRHDKRINTLATALLAKQNADMLRKAGLEASGEMLYMMHNIGPGVISAVKSGQVNGATLKAMQQNGMKPGMTPVAFVDYQKDRFQDHYATANSVAPNIGGSNIDGAPIGRNKQESYIGGSAARSSDRVVAGQTPGTSKSNTTNGNSGSYAGSVENTKQNPGVAKTPSYTQDQLPKENSPYGVGPKNSMGGFNLNGGARPQPNTFSDSNKSIVVIEQAVIDSLTVQKQIHSVLTEISGKMNIGELINALKGVQPKAEESKPKAAEPEKPAQYTDARMNQGQTKKIPTALVPMTRG